MTVYHYVKGGAYAASALTQITRNMAATLNTYYRSPSTSFMNRYWKCTQVGTTAASVPVSQGYEWNNTPSDHRIYPGDVVTDGTAKFTNVTGNDWTTPWESLVDTFTFVYTQYSTRVGTVKIGDVVYVSSTSVDNFVVSTEIMLQWQQWATALYGILSSMPQQYQYDIKQTIKLISVNDSAFPPTTEASGAVINITGQNFISGLGYFKGFNININGGNLNEMYKTYGIASGNSSNIHGLYFENCNITFQTNAATQWLLVGTNNSIDYFVNGTITFNNYADSIYLRGGKAVFKGITFAVSGTAPAKPIKIQDYTSQVYEDTGFTKIIVVFDSCDLSALTGGMSVLTIESKLYDIQLINCKLPANNPVFIQDLLTNVTNSKISIVDCYYSTTLLPNIYTGKQYTATEDFTVYHQYSPTKKTWNGSNTIESPYSWKVETGKIGLKPGIRWAELPWIEVFQFCSDPNKNFHVYLDFMVEGVNPITYFDFWIDILTPNQTVGLSYITGKKSILAAPTNHSITRYDWTGKTGIYAMRVSIDTQIKNNKTPIIVIPCVSRNRMKLWVNPKPYLIAF